MYVSFTNVCFVINICIIPNEFQALLIAYQNITKNLFSLLIKTYFDQKFHGAFIRVPWNFSNNIWTTCVVPWYSMELKLQNLKFHRIPWNFVQIQSSMEFHGTFSILLNSMDFHWNFWSSLEFHKIPWNLISLILKMIIFLNIIVGIWLMIACNFAKISHKPYSLHWFQYHNLYFEHPSVSEMAQGQRKWHAVIIVRIVAVTLYAHRPKWLRWLLMPWDAEMGREIVGWAFTANSGKVFPATDFKRNR